MSEFMSSLVDSHIVDLPFLSDLNHSVSLEAGNAPFLDGARSSFTSLVDSIGTFFTGMKVGNFKPIRIDAKPLLTHIEASGGWANVRLKPISIPTGFKSGYVEFMTHTLKLLPEVERLEAELSQVQAKLASLINDHTRMSAQSGLSFALKDLGSVSTQELDHYKAHFSDNKRASARLCDVYSRAADVEATYKAVNEINQRLGKVDFSAIRSKIDRLMELAADLKRTLSDEEGQHVSGTVAKQLSGYLYSMASVVSLSSVMTHAMDEVNICLSKNISELTTG